MAELTTTQAHSSSSCCSTAAQKSCCEPADKDACCGAAAAGGDCGCSAGSVGQDGVRETVRALRGGRPGSGREP